MLNRKERPKISTAIKLMDFIDEKLLVKIDDEQLLRQIRKWNGDVKYILNDMLNRKDVVEVKK